MDKVIDEVVVTARRRGQLAIEIRRPDGAETKVVGSWQEVAAELEKLNRETWRFRG